MLPAALLPLTICGVIMAAVIGLVLAFRPAWRQIMALIVVSATAGLGAYLIAQGFLGALPHEAVATWAALSLTVLAVGATAAGLIALTGAGGLGLGVVLMIFVGNPFSGATSAPELLPAPAAPSGSGSRPARGPACCAAPPTSAARARRVTSSCWSPGSRQAWRRSSPVTTHRSGSRRAGPGSRRHRPSRTWPPRTTPSHRKVPGQIMAGRASMDSDMFWTYAGRMALKIMPHGRLQEWVARKRATSRPRGSITAS